MVHASAAVAPQRLHAQEVLFQPEVEVSEIMLLFQIAKIVLAGCPNNAFAGPNSAFYYNNCPNAYAFPDNDGMSCVRR